MPASSKCLEPVAFVKASPVPPSTPPMISAQRWRVGGCGQARRRGIRATEWGLRSQRDSARERPGRKERGNGVRSLGCRVQGLGLGVGVEVKRERGHFRRGGESQNLDRGRQRWTELDRPPYHQKRDSPHHISLAHPSSLSLPLALSRCLALAPTRALCRRRTPSFPLPLTIPVAPLIAAGALSLPALRMLPTCAFASCACMK